MHFFKLFFFFLVFFSLTAPFSYSFFEKNEAGLEIFSFSRTFQSPRNMSMERSAAALPSNDPSIVQLNPAGLEIQNNKKNVVALYWQTGAWAENQGFLSYSRKLNAMNVQASYGWIRYGDIDGYDEYGNSTGQIHSPQSQLFTLTSSFPLTHFRFGSTVKLATDKLSGEVGDRTAIALAFDWGFSWQSSSTLYGFALTARDFGSMIRDYVDDSSDDYYAMAQTVSIAAFLKPRTIPRLSLLMESSFPRYSQPTASLGAEYILGKYVFLRAGFNRTWLDLSRDAKELFASNSRPSESNEARLFSLGAGFLHEIFSLDYSFSYLTQGLGLEHRFGLSFNF